MMDGRINCPSPLIVLLLSLYLLVGGCRGVDRPESETVSTCAAPAAAFADYCAELEEQILQATVQIEIINWTVIPGEKGYEIDRSRGHATILGGRYLVTHNHAHVLRNIRTDAYDQHDYSQVVLSTAAGQPFFHGPFSDFTVVEENDRELVLAYKQPGLFSGTDLHGAEFTDWRVLPLETGREVAQVDWDGQTTHVDWTTIQSVQVGDGVPRMMVANGITLGASGGGIFWQGGHIGINWCQVQEYDAAGELIDCHTGVALDPAALLYR